MQAKREWHDIYDISKELGKSLLIRTSLLKRVKSFPEKQKLKLKKYITTGLTLPKKEKKRGRF